ncbi:hypothetical protein TA3x_000435 [Tundrisphaera sp. TA3]|uniref:hypothetical protein n=1 Tax=Tundrisphaera sp. TA3 TaxID=3435775 RepID=UPI003EBAC763
MNDQPSSLEGLLTAEEAAKLCGFTRSNLYYYLEGDDKPPKRMWNGRVYYVRDQLVAWNERRLARQG